MLDPFGQVGELPTYRLAQESQNDEISHGRRRCVKTMNQTDPTRCWAADDCQWLVFLIRNRILQVLKSHRGVLLEFDFEFIAGLNFNLVLASEVMAIEAQNHLLRTRLERDRTCKSVVP